MNKPALKQRERRRRLREAQCTLPLPEPGFIVIDGKNIQCHICGFWGKALATHIRSIHNMTCEEYRDDYGLNRRQPLCGEEHSAKLASNIIKQGINGKYGDLDKAREALRLVHQKHRLQANIRQSECRLGKPRKITEARTKASRANLKKALRLVPCNICGTLVSRNSNRKAYCDNCRSVHKNNYSKNYRKNNPERYRRYEKNRRRKLL